MADILNIWDETQQKYIGIPAIKGKTAYEYAQDGGYTGTEAEFAEKMAADETGLIVNLTPTGVDSYGFITGGTADTDSSVMIAAMKAGRNVFYKMVGVENGAVPLMCQGDYVVAQIMWYTASRVFSYMISQIGTTVYIYRYEVATPEQLPTDLEKNTWNAKSDFSGSYNDLSDKPIILTETDVDTLIDTKLGVIENGSY